MPKALEGLDSIREKVRVRDNHTCQDCGKKWIEGTRRFDVHHLNIKMESSRSYQYDRTHLHLLTTLCHKCHLTLPHNRVKMRKLPSSFVVEREKLIYKRVQTGETFKKVAPDFNLTRQRVHQIYKAYLQKLSTTLS